MSKLVSTATAQLRQALAQAIQAAIDAGQLPQAPLPEIQLEVPADRSHGDWSCNAAMAGARSFRMAPQKIAQAIQENLDLSATYFASCQIAGPGFLNFTYHPRFYGEVLQDIHALGGCLWHLGRRARASGCWWSSSPPTPPAPCTSATPGAARWATLWPLCWSGPATTCSREFYVNDAGNQIEKFGISLSAAVSAAVQGRGRPCDASPEDGYHGEDIIDHAKDFCATTTATRLWKPSGGGAPDQALVDYALPKNIAGPPATTWPATGSTTTTGFRRVHPPRKRRGGDGGRSC